MMPWLLKHILYLSQNMRQIEEVLLYKLKLKPAKSATVQLFYFMLSD